jgi:septum formation protein
MSAALSEGTPLILGSASPRRREILTSLGIAHLVLPAAIDESVRPGELPAAYLERVVFDKLGAVAARVEGRKAAALLVADTSVVLGDEIFGKPADAADAVRLLERLVGRAHRVLTRYALGRPDGSLLAARTVSTEVWLRAAARDELAGYARSGEGLDKAGAYAIQGLGAFLVEGIAGSYSNVVGLPACELVLDLKQHGLLESFP